MTTVLLASRLNSKRLPKKALADIAGKPMLRRVIERCRKFAERVWVVTPNRIGEIGALCDQPGVYYWYTPDVPEDDVLSRLVRMCDIYAMRYDEKIVRVTHDCPLIMPSISRAVVDGLSSRVDYCSNCRIERTYPVGTETEVFWLDSLLKMSRLTEGADREHVTACVWPPAFRFSNTTAALPSPNFRWCVDTPEDLAYVNRIYKEVDNPEDYEEVLAWSNKNPHPSAAKQQNS